MNASAQGSFMLFNQAASVINNFTVHMHAYASLSPYVLGDPRYMATPQPGQPHTHALSHTHTHKHTYAAVYYKHADTK